MPKYRVYFLREDLSQRFRDLPPASVKKQIKEKDYEAVGEIEAANTYAAWQALRAAGGEVDVPVLARPFNVGDVLEAEGARPELCLFGGFEEVAWWVPEPKAEAPAEPGQGASATAAADPAEGTALPEDSKG